MSLKKNQENSFSKKRTQDFSFVGDVGKFWWGKMCGSGPLEIPSIIFMIIEIQGPKESPRKNGSQGIFLTYPTVKNKTVTIERKIQEKI